MKCNHEAIEPIIAFEAPEGDVGTKQALMLLRGRILLTKEHRKLYTFCAQNADTIKKCFFYLARSITRREAKKKVFRVHISPRIGLEAHNSYRG